MALAATGEASRGAVAGGRTWTTRPWICPGEAGISLLLSTWFTGWGRARAVAELRF
jgi:hypothetical protein